MRKKIIYLLFGAFSVCVLLSTPVFAVDLPINIDAIGQQEWADEILTLRLNIDLFSENAKLVNRAIEEQIRINRENAETGLFLRHQEYEPVSIEYRVRLMAGDLNLFWQPMNFGTIGQLDTEEFIPTWVIVITLLSCALIGYMLAKMIVGKREANIS